MARGGYTFSQIREMTDLEILYLYHYQELAIKEQQQFLTSVLGVVWDKDSLISQESETSKSAAAKPVESLFIPLSLAINPNVMDFVRSQFKVPTQGKGLTPIAGGEYVPKGNERIASMADLPKDEFMKLLGKKSL